MTHTLTIIETFRSDKKYFGQHTDDIQILRQFGTDCYVFITLTRDNVEEKIVT